MKWSRMVNMIEAHAEGEVGRVVTGGVVGIPGGTMLEKMNYLNRVDDSLRRFCVFEPRGYAPMSTNLLLPPCRDDADLGFIVLQSDRAHAMSGSNAICVVTAALETGMLPMSEPVTVVSLDTPAGLVKANATCDNGKCVEVALDMTPGFVELCDASVDVAGIGKLKVDIVFGGVYYALVDPACVSLDIRPENARALVDAGCRIQRAVNSQLSFHHPEIPALDRISYVMFIGQTGEGYPVGATILPPGRIDRSPCGTGNTARLALRHFRGDARPGDVQEAYSIIGSRFGVAFTGLTTIAGRPAVRARISGRGWIHGMHRIGVDPSDPFQEGFLLSDCWGDAFDLLS